MMAFLKCCKTIDVLLPVDFVPFDFCKESGV